MQRQILYGSNTLVAIVMFATILLLVNVLPRELKAVTIFGSRVPLQKQWDLTESRRFSLTDQSLKVLWKLDTPVTAIGFALKGRSEYQELEDMLKAYAFQSRSFTYRIEDPERNPTIARQYGIKSMRTLVLESKGKKETVTLPPGARAADFSQMESKITAGLLRMMNPTVATIYFTRGHGESEVDDQSQRGIAEFKSSLEGENYVVKSTYLFNEKGRQVPDDATAVVIAGLTKDFLPDETKMLDKYMQRGGRILCFYNPTMNMKSFPLLEKFFTSRGITPENDLIFSTQVAPLQVAERVLLPAVTKYGTSPIVENFKEATVFPVARSLKLGKAPKDSTTNALAYTIPETYAIRHPVNTELLTAVAETQNPASIFKKDEDTKGEAILAAVGTYPATPVDLSLPHTPTESPAGSPAEASAAPKASRVPATSLARSGSPAAAPSSPGAASAVSGASPSPSPAKPKTEARIVVFGSSQMIMKTFFGFLGNSDIVMNSVAWLAERTEQIAISRPDVKKQPLSLDDRARKLIGWFAMLVLPCMVGMLGLIIHSMLKRH